jgi:uncharacterized protein YdeI (YjbR/CyaY-like superfamily)
VEISKTLYVTDRDDWRRWLSGNYRSEGEIWLVYYRKETGKPRIPYKDAVEEALCFGWIDSQTKKIDEERFAQRFTPRNPGSSHSQTNKERLRKLLAQGMVMPEVAAGLGDELDPERFVFPPDIMAELKSRPKAWENFQGHSGPYQRIRIAFIDGARSRPGEFEKRLRYFLDMTEQGKQFGFDIEEFY